MPTPTDGAPNPNVEILFVGLDNAQATVRPGPTITVLKRGIASFKIFDPDPFSLALVPSVSPSESVPILLVLSLRSLLLASLDLRRLVQRMLTDTLRVRPGLDRLGKAVPKACKWEFAFRGKDTNFLDTVKILLTAAMLGDSESSSVNDMDAQKRTSLFRLTRITHLLPSHPSNSSGSSKITGFLPPLSDSFVGFRNIRPVLISPLVTSKFSCYRKSQRTEMLCIPIPCSGPIASLRLEDPVRTAGCQVPHVQHRSQRERRNRPCSGCRQRTSSWLTARNLRSGSA